MNKEIVVSIKTVVFTLLFILLGYVVYRLGPIISILLISFLIVIAVEPMVKKFMGITLLNRPISRGLAVLLAYIILIVVVTIILTLILPNFIIQTQKLLTSMASTISSLNLSQQIDFSTEGVVNQITKVSSGFISALYGSFKVLLTLFSVLIISIYMSTDWENIKKTFAGFFSERVEEEVLKTFEEVEVSISHWVKGQLILMLVVGFFSFLGLLILDVDYPVALGLLAGVLEAVPMMGPIIAAVFAGTIAFVDTPIKGLGVIVLFIIIQQLENNILVPKIMQKVSGFSPLVILIALLVGGQMFGLIGAVLAVPFTMIGSIVLKRFLLEKF